MPVKATPDGYSSVTPYLTVKDGAEAIEFYKKAFGAVERMRMPMPDGRVGHAELKIGNSVIMLASECPEMPGAKSPQGYGGTPVGIYLYVEDVDTIVKQAVAAGATLAKPVENQFYGDRTGGLTDPFGHRWNVATHVEDVSMEELKKRMAEMMGKKAAAA
jgi:PhnB protein